MTTEPCFDPFVAGQRHPLVFPTVSNIAFHEFEPKV